MPRPGLPHTIKTLPFLCGTTAPPGRPKPGRARPTLNYFGLVAPQGGAPVILQGAAMLRPGFTNPINTAPVPGGTLSDLGARCSEPGAQAQDPDPGIRIPASRIRIPGSGSGSQDLDPGIPASPDPDPGL